MKGQEFKIVAAFVLIFGFIAIIVVYQNLQTESSARIKYEYETLKSYLKLPESTLNKLFYGGGLAAHMKYVEGVEFEDKILFKVRNTGDVPLTGFHVTFNEFVVISEIVPYMLPPKFDGVIIIESRKIAGEGVLTISTDQSAALHITKPE